MRRVCHGTILMLECLSILCLVLSLLPKNHAFNNNNKLPTWTTHPLDRYPVVARDITRVKKTSSLVAFLSRNQPTSSTIRGPSACSTRLRNNLQQKDQAALRSKVTSKINGHQQQELQEGTRFQRWKQRTLLRLNRLVKRGESLLHWRNTSQATVDDPSFLSKDDKNDHASLRTLTTPLLPNGPRWAIAHPNVDLSGTWKPIVTNEFIKEYDAYLQNCGTNFALRHVCLNFCSLVREIIQQEDEGRVLHLTGTSPAGTWKRSLISSGAEYRRRDGGGAVGMADVVDDDDNYQPIYTEFLDPDKELIQVEAWWQDQGRVHTSFLRNKPKVCGGEFESRRYLTTDAATGNVNLVCESFFHPASSKEEHSSSSSSSTASSISSQFKPAYVKWTYQRV
jgi:hypothetical protein